MSSVSSFKPEDDSESASGALQDCSPGRRRQTRSLSRAASVAVTSSSSSEASDSDVDSESDDTQNQNQDLEARIQSLNPRALEAYLRLFADEESQFTFAKIDEDAEIFNVTQHGAVIWTATEKEKFFNHLDRKGRNGIREIAAAIGTKSELEVMDYIDLLHEGLISQHVASLHNSTVVMGDIPAAVEISDACRSQLDQYADALALQEEMNQLALGRNRYGNNWIIADNQARRLIENGGEPLRGSIHLAAGIFNVPNWVMLSRRIFMNFGGKREEDNWTNVIKSAAETPSISGDALMEFYALTMSITRRLIQSSMFFAMSRFRQLEQLGKEPEDISSTVRAKDVRAALDVLNMKHHRGKFILDAVRRNGLVIADIRNEKGWEPQFLDYDEVEQMLNGDDDDLRPERDFSQSEPDGGSDADEEYEGESDAGRHDLPGRAEHEPPAPPEAETEADDADDEEDEEQRQSAPPLAQAPPEQATTPGEPPSQDSDHPPPQLTRRLSNQSYLSSGADEEEQASDAEEEHAERYDQEYSRIAERKMWSLLQQPGPPTLSAPRLTEDQIKEDAEHRPFVKRKTRREMTGWRDITLYHSEWEEYGSDVPGLVEELAENRRKRRRIVEEAMWETGDEEGEGGDSESGSEGDGQVESGGLGAVGPVPKSASVVNSEEDSDLEKMDLEED